MGGCCYSPRRTDFLWWYWLVLTFIFCIPMTIAALVVRRASKLTDKQDGSADVGADEQPNPEGRGFAVFVVASGVSLVLLMLVGWFVVRQPALCTFGLGFATGLVLATAADRARRRQTWEGSRVFPFLFFGITWLVLWVGACVVTSDPPHAGGSYAGDRMMEVASTLGTSESPVPPQHRAEPDPSSRTQETSRSVRGRGPDDDVLSFPPSRSPFAAVLTFFACLVPAYFWGSFSSKPTRVRAVSFLIALVCGGFLYWVVLGGLGSTWV